MRGTVPENDKVLQIRQARGQFAAMAGAYFMGNFNDNFFKQAVMLLAVAALQEQFQGYVVIAFSVPFMLFAAPAGWMADRFPKRNVVIAAKGTELAAACIGAIGVLTGHLWVMVGMVGLMGVQSTFFSPALNGSIPEVYPASYVIKANAILRMIVNIGILIGISLAGPILDLKGPVILGAAHGRGVLGLCVVGFAILGLVVSFGTPSRPPADPRRAFPWSGPLDTLRELANVWKDHQLGRILLADVFIWAMGVFQVQVINPLGVNQFSLGKTGAGLLVAAQMLGLAGGSLLSARFAKGARWFRVLIPAGLGMAILMGAIALVPLAPGSFQVPLVFSLIGLAGVAGGLFLIPCESFLQTRPAPARKGAVWASANFASFAGMAMAGALYIPLKFMKPTLAYGVLGILALLFTAWLAAEFRKKEWA